VLLCSSSSRCLHRQKPAVTSTRQPSVVSTWRWRPTGWPKSGVRLKQVRTVLPSWSSVSKPHHLRTAYAWQVLLFASQGLWTEAEQVIALAQPIVDALSDPVPAAFLRQFRGFLAYQQEEYRVAECELQNAQLDQSFQSGLGDLMFYLGLLGLVQATMGKEQEARAYMARVEAQLALLPAGILSAAPLLICLALAAMTLGDHGRTTRLYPALLAFGGQHYWFLVDRVLGMLSFDS